MPGASPYQEISFQDWRGLLPQMRAAEYWRLSERWFYTFCRSFLLDDSPVPVHSGVDICLGCPPGASDQICTALHGDQLWQDPGSSSVVPGKELSGGLEHQAEDMCSTQSCSCWLSSQRLLLWGLSAFSSHQITKQILRRKWGWIRHTLRKPASSTTRWNPQGKRKRGRPRNSWRWDTEAELKQQGANWSGMTRAAQNRERWQGGRWWPMLHWERWA